MPYAVRGIGGGVGGSGVGCGVVCVWLQLGSFCGLADGRGRRRVEDKGFTFRFGGVDARNCGDFRIA